LEIIFFTPLNDWFSAAMYASIS
jgi:hypothetical protein